MNDVKQAMTPEEREELDKLHVKADSRGGTTSKQAETLVSLLRKAEEKGLLWATWVLDSFTVRGAQSMHKTWRKRQGSVALAWNGAIVNKPMVSSVPSRKNTSGKSAGFEMRLWEDMTWEQVEAKALEFATQERAATQNKVMAIRLLSLAPRVPTATTVGEALVALGLSIDEYLATGTDDA